MVTWNVLREKLLDAACGFIDISCTRTCYYFRHFSEIFGAVKSFQKSSQMFQSPQILTRLIQMQIEEIERKTLQNHLDIF